MMGRSACILADLFHGTHTCREIHAQLAAEPLPAEFAVSSDEEGDIRNIALQGAVRRKRKPKSKYASMSVGYQNTLNLPSARIVVAEPW